MLGLTLLSGIAFADVSALILPVAISLAAAPLLSRLSAVRISHIGLRILRMDTPHTLVEPTIVQSARLERAWIKSALAEQPPAQAFAAE